MVPVRKLARLALAIGVAALALIGWFWWNRAEDGPPLPRTEAQAEAERGGKDDDGLPELVMLQPGTELGTRLPARWSNRVIQSILHLASGDVHTLPSSAKTTATKFRTVVLADVRRDRSGTGFRLRRVGIGLSMVREGRDLVISSATMAEQGVSLSTLDGLVFGRAEKALARSHLVAETPTFALYETFVELADKAGRHRSILLRYAIVVDPQTGTLETVSWPVAEDPNARTAPDSLVVLSPNLVYQCGIHVLARRIAGVVVGWGFAMTELPPGEPFVIPPELRALAVRDSFRPDEAAELERLVRQVLRREVGTRGGSPGRF